MSSETTTALAERSALPEAVARRGVDEAQWRTLCNNLYPGANPQSVLMVVDYCKARGLDPLKKPCHIVPMDVQVNGEWTKRDVVMPGIYEYRITAHRTGLYLGHTEPEYGDTKKLAGVEAPEWCALTVKRWNPTAGREVAFPVRVFFAEVVATKRDGHANQRWAKAPIQMLTKCTEAAGLREAFPEEFGGEPTAEEMDGQTTIPREEPKPAIQQPQRKSETAEAEPARTKMNADDLARHLEQTGQAFKPAGVTLVKAQRRESKTQPGTFFWLVQDSAGAIYFVKTDELGQACAKFKDAGTPVEITSEAVAGQQYPDLTEITAVQG